VPLTAVAVVPHSLYVLSGDAEGFVSLHVLTLPSLSTTLLARYPAHQACVASLQRLPDPPLSIGPGFHMDVDLHNFNQPPTNVNGNLNQGRAPAILASCGRGGLIKLWTVDRAPSALPLLHPRTDLRFVGHLQGERPFTAAALLPPQSPGHHGAGGVVYRAACGYEDGMLEVVQTSDRPLTDRQGREQQRHATPPFRAKAHASKVRRGS
jgi:hypothetical protein